MTVSPPEPNSLPSWMRRLWPVFCLLAVAITFGYALFDPYQVDGDAVSYMDIGDLIRSHQWDGVVNAYWHPLYPAMLSLGHTLFHATRFTELHAYYMVNFAIFLLEMLAIVCFTDALATLREVRAAAMETATATAHTIRFLLDGYALRYLGVGLLVIASQRELSLGKVRPDALLQALLLFALAALLRHLAFNKLRFAALMGLALGFAYLTKSFAFLFTLLCIGALLAFGLFWTRQRPVRVAAAGLVALVCFSVLAGPYIAALSRQKGRFDFGDSGSLNYTWYVGGTEKMHLQPEQTALFGSAEVHLKHPERELMQDPVVLSYKQLPYGTYPDWFDTSFWNDQIKTHMNPRGQIRALTRNSVLTVRYLLNHPEGWTVLALLLLAGSRFELSWRPTANAFWLAPVVLGCAIFCIYGMVNIEERYVTVGYFAILIPLFAMLKAPPAQAPEGIRTAASALVLALAMLALGGSARTVAELRRQLSLVHSPGGWYDPSVFGAAHALNDLGVGPGDSIACIGTLACLNDIYWARLAGVRILTEIYEPEAPLYPVYAAMPHREQAIEIVRREGGKVLVGSFSPGRMTGTSALTAGWIQLDQSPLYAFPLNLAPAAATGQTR